MLGNTSNVPVVYTVYFMGKIEDVNLSGVNSRDADVLLIDKVEESQVGVENSAVVFWSTILLMLLIFYAKFS